MFKGKEKKMNANKIEVMSMTEAKRCIYYMCCNNDDNRLYPLARFLVEFEELNGYPLPTYCNATPMDFLRSISDVVRMVTIDDEIYLRRADLDRKKKKKKGANNAASSKKVPPFPSLPPPPAALTRPITPPSPSETPITVSTSGFSSPPHPYVPSTSPIPFVKKKTTLDFLSDEEGEPERTPIHLEYKDDGMTVSYASLEPRKIHGPLFDKYVSKVVISEIEMPVMKFKKFARVGKVMKVAVQEVESPHRFIMHLSNQSFRLRVLMERMRKFYAMYEEMYAVVSYKFCANDLCAVLYRTNKRNREWYRAKIIHFGSEKSKVLLIDYGLTAETWNRNLKFLDREFANLPAQAINGRLAHIKPPTGNQWSEESCKTFYKLVFEKDFSMEIVDLSFKKNWLSVELKHLDEPTCINYILVEKNLAALCSPSDEQRRADYKPRIYQSVKPGKFIKAEAIKKSRRARSEIKGTEDDLRRKLTPSGAVCQVRKHHRAKNRDYEDEDDEDLTPVDIEHQSRKFRRRRRNHYQKPEPGTASEPSSELPSDYGSEFSSDSTVEYSST